MGFIFFKEIIQYFWPAVKQLKDLLSSRLQQLKRTEGTRARVVDARVKKPAKILKKAVKYNYSASKALNEIVDVLGIRIVCNNLSDIESVIKMIKQAQNSTAESDLATFQTIRITATIDCFVVVPDHRQNLFEIGEAGKDLFATDWVFFYPNHFLFCILIHFL